MELLAQFFIIVALVWIGSKVDMLGKNVEALATAVREAQERRCWYWSTLELERV